MPRDPRPCDICGSTMEPQYLCPCLDLTCPDLVCRSCYGRILSEVYYSFYDRDKDDDGS